MDLSVIIVNYNVKYFLEQALLSVKKASTNLLVEVFVVDNNSVDESVTMVKEKFPSVQLIANQQNTGFAVANNQAYALAKGKYILLLNPDTVVEEDTFRKCFDFMEQHPVAGALGVRMIDGSGKFLPESKRGFPTPFVAFCKTLGLSSIFSKSKLFNQYYLGHLAEMDTNEIDVLAGAFMFMRQAALLKVGMLDEAFFMYGEDIDLSYRIVKGGYKNYYFPETSIIHYKGESTKKGSLNYVKTFYQAMIIFAKKHFSGRQGQVFVAMLQVAIYFRAFLTLLANFANRCLLPASDVVLIFIGMYFLKDYWAISRFGDLAYYKSSLLFFNVPLYISGWLLSVYFHGGYDRKDNIAAVAKGLAVGSVLLIAIYGLLPTEYRSSRMLLLLGAIWASISMIGLRLLLHFLKHRNFQFGQNQVKNLIIIGEKTESDRVRQLMFHAQVQKNFIGTVSPKAIVDNLAYLSDMSMLDEVIRIYRVNEVIFCSKDISSQEIMSQMTRLGAEIDYKIVPQESLSIIGSSSKNDTGELYTIDIQFGINTMMSKRNKRVFDIVISLLSILFLPLLLFKSKGKKLFFQHIGYVFLGKKTWISYASDKKNTKNLPKLKAGVFTPLSGLGLVEPNSTTVHRLDFLYAKDYQLAKDIEILWRYFTKSK